LFEHHGRSDTRTTVKANAFIITEKGRVRERRCEGVGVMKDKELKLEDVDAPHTLGGE